jgi:hypothetical protein
MITAYVIALICISERSGYVNAVKGAPQEPESITPPTPESPLVPVEIKLESRYKKDSIAGQLEEALEKEFPDDK